MKRLILLALLLPSIAFADTNITCLRNTACTIQFELRDAEGATPGLDLEASATCATGDVTKIEDGATSANTTNCFTSEGGGVYSLVLAAGDVDGKITTVTIDDQTATEVWIDKVINVYTYGDSSAFHTVPDVNVESFDTGAIDAGAIAADAIGASEIAADAIGSSEIASGAIVKGTEITGFNDLSAASVNAEVDTAIETYHLDHLLAADYDPASKPGTSTALFNELVEDDSGVSRYTANALEQGPSGGGGGSFGTDCATLTDPDSVGYAACRKPKLYE